MIRIAICDDEAKELERTQNLLKQFMQQHAQFELKIYCFSAPLELLTYIAEQGGFDIILLDVYMTGMLGTTAARELRQLGEAGEIVFITNSRDHAVEAFEVEAAQYLIKPYTETALFAVLDKIMLRISKNKKVMISLKTSEGIRRLAVNDVVYTETGRNNYQLVHTIQGEKFEVRMTAKELFEVLEQYKFFVRCGAAINLNLKYVRQISKEVISFDTGAQLTYPYRVYQKLKDDFLRFQMVTED